MVLDNGPLGIHARKKDLVLGLDPGRDKTGFAFVNLDGGLIISGIFLTEQRDEFFAGNFSGFVIEGEGACALSDVKFIALGSGTQSREFHEYIKSRVTCEIVITDEKNTTLEARKLYWKIHKPGIIARLIPEGLRVPDRILDDLAAWAIALRALKKL